MRKGDQVTRIDHPSFKALVGARPVAAAMASESAHPVSTSGGGGDERQMLSTMIWRT